MNSSEKEPIQTLIFMDFEVAGELLETEFSGDLQPRNAAGLDNTEYLEKLLASDVDLVRVPRIAEMSFVFVPRSLFTEAAENMHHKLSKHENEGAVGSLNIDIAANIFTAQLNPDLSEEHWALYESKRASIRLRRTELIEKNSFAQEWPAVHHMLRVSPKPACLVAHNGLQFDFRILMHELARTDMLRQHPIPEQVFFLDSYLTFRHIEKAHHRTIQQTLSTIDWNVIFPPQQTVQSCPSLTEDDQLEEEQPPTKTAVFVDEEQFLVGDNNDERGKNKGAQEEEEIVVVAADCPLANCLLSPAHSDTSSVIVEEQQQAESSSSQAQKKSDKTTTTTVMEKEEEEIVLIGRKEGGGNGRGRIWGRQQQQQNRTIRKRKHPLEGLHPKHPFRFLRRSEWSPAKRLRVPASLFERDLPTGQWHFSNHASERLLRNSGNFKLPNMFRMLIGTDFRAHRAQADSEALLQVCLSYGQDFVEYADEKSAQFPKTTNW